MWSALFVVAEPVPYPCLYKAESLCYSTAAFDEDGRCPRVQVGESTAGSDDNASVSTTGLMEGPSSMVTAISFLIVLSVLVMVHELGHYVAGRWAGARIEEFALGFPPRVWSVRRGETDYSINAVPLGGYVRFAGEDNPDVVGGLASLPRLKRSLVLVAGVTMNAVLAVLLFAWVFATGYPTAVPIDGVKIISVVEDAPAALAGIKPGDIVLKIDDQVTNDTNTLGTGIRSHLGQEITLLVKRPSGDEEMIRVVPRSESPQGQGPLGIVIEQATRLEMRSYSLPQALWMGVRQTWQAVALTVSVPVMILRGLIPAELARPVGPLGISRIVGSAAEAIPASGFAPILLTTALLSVSLAIVNILPLPGFDGGRLVFVVLEWLRGGKRINPQREAIIHFAGLMLIIGLVVVITYFDIVSPAPSINWVP